MKDNCVWLKNKIVCELQIQEQATAAKAVSEKSTRTHVTKNSSSNLGPICGPDCSDKPSTDKRIVGLVETISSQNVSAEVKFECRELWQHAPKLT